METGRPSPRERTPLAERVWFTPWAEVRDWAARGAAARGAAALRGEGVARGAGVAPERGAGDAPDDELERGDGVDRGVCDERGAGVALGVWPLEPRDVGVVRLDDVLEFRDVELREGAGFEERLLLVDGVFRVVATGLREDDFEEDGARGAGLLVVARRALVEPPDLAGVAPSWVSRAAG